MAYYMTFKRVGILIYFFKGGSDLESCRGSESELRNICL